MNPATRAFVSGLLVVGLVTAFVGLLLLGRDRTRDHVAEHTSAPPHVARPEAGATHHLADFDMAAAIMQIQRERFYEYLDGLRRLHEADARRHATRHATSSSNVTRANSSGSFPAECIARHESGGSYTAYNPEPAGNGNASGKYQITSGTWSGYGGYSEARDAPPGVQEQQARELWSRDPHAWHGTGCPGT